jgi:hypothetical protein
MAEPLKDDARLAAGSDPLGAGDGKMSHGPAAGAAASPALPATRNRETARLRGPHAVKFRIAMATLIAIGLASLAFALLFAGNQHQHRPSARWSGWSPSDGGTIGAGEIAGHIAPFYRATAANQLDVVTLVNLANPNAGAGAPGSASGLELAVQTGSTPSSLVLLTGNTIAYNICGVGTFNCALAGTPTSARLLLLRREALELALYTLRYIGGTENVVALLPPARTLVASTLSQMRPKARTATRSLGLALLFDRQELAPLLQRPLNQTLAPYPPVVRQLPLWLKTPDAGIVDQVTARGMFVQRFEQLQDGSHLLVLTTLPPQ